MGAHERPRPKEKNFSYHTSEFRFGIYNCSTRGSYKSTARCQAIPQLYGGLAFFMTRKTFIKNLKMLFAAHHYVFNSQEIADIAVVINLSPKRVEKLMQADEWAEAVAYWKGNPVGKEGDLGLAEKLWAYMVENGEHTNLVEYPDTPFSAPKGAGDPDVYALIQSHLFCVDNLCDDEIRSRIAEERKFESPPREI